MLDTPIVDVALGLMFVYLVLSLICSGIQEWLASVTRLRSRNLRTGIANLLDGPNAQNLTHVTNVYGHPLIANLARKGRLPSYIPTDLLSSVVLDAVAQEAGKKSYADLAAEEVDAMIDGLDDNHPLKPVLRALANKAKAEGAQLRATLAGWFDDGMERIGGWYARTVRLWLFGIAIVVALAANANTLTMVERIWQNDTLRTYLAAQAVAATESDTLPTLDELRGDEDMLPIGWSARDDFSPRWFVHSIAGWLLTIAAISLGAPFWFDLLGRVARLRGAGGKPKTEAEKAAAKPA